MIGQKNKRRFRRFTNRIRDFTSGYSNVDKWSAYYADLREPRLYGDETTYRMAADFFADVDLVEDWGCGAGGFRAYCRTGYVGIDGSTSPFADKIVDLASYKSEAEGILLRHVLEHNYRWKPILKNATASFRRKLCIILFTPFSPRTRSLRYCGDFRVPDISFSKSDLIEHFDQHKWTLDENIETDSEYGVEHIFKIEAPTAPDVRYVP